MPQPKHIPVYYQSRVFAVAVVDSDDYDRVTLGPRWLLHKDGYATRMHKGKREYLHRLVLGYSGPKSVDHKNRNPLDCRKENLRPIKQGKNGWANIQRIESRLSAFQAHIETFIQHGGYSTIAPVERGANNRK
jgi:hypothetical protein